MSAIIFWRTSDRFARHRLAEGKIGKVRVLQADTNEALAILDFSVKNLTDRPIVVRSLLPLAEMADGSTIDGRIVSARDLDNIFRNNPELGQRFNDPLIAQDTLPANAEIDRMAGVSFDVPESVMKQRKDILLRIDTNIGVIAELRSK
ncbi:MAG: hypothetical protein KGN84_18785 [Acidobacteriota bacterium]|nr:hypothetical protein [Acidobacteriota bacterium]